MKQKIGCRLPAILAKQCATPTTQTGSIVRQHQWGRLPAVKSDTKIDHSIASSNEPAWPPEVRMLKSRKILILSSSPSLMIYVYRFDAGKALHYSWEKWSREIMLPLSPALHISTLSWAPSTAFIWGNLHYEGYSNLFSSNSTLAHVAGLPNRAWERALSGHNSVDSLRINGCSHTLSPRTGNECQFVSPLQ